MAGLGKILLGMGAAANPATAFGILGKKAYDKATAAPDMPTPTALPNAPTVDPAADAIVAARAAILAKRRAEITGGRQTLLTGPQGVSGPAPVVTKSLLGA